MLVTAQQILRKVGDHISDMLLKVKKKKIRMIWGIYLLPLLESGGECSDIHCENLVKLLQLKVTQIWWPFMTWVPLGFLIVGNVHTEPPIIHQWCSGFPTLVLLPTEVSALVKCDPLFPTCLLNLWGEVCPVISLLWWILEELLTFQFIWLFVRTE